MKLFNTKTIELKFDPKEVKYTNIEAFCELNNRVQLETINSLEKQREIPLIVFRNKHPEAFKTAIKDIYEENHELRSIELTSCKLEITNKFIFNRVKITLPYNPVLTEILLNNIVELEMENREI